MTSYWPTIGRLKCILAIGNLVCSERDGESKVFYSNNA